MYIELDWDDFRDHVINWSLKPYLKYHESDKLCFCYVYDGNFCFQARIVRDGEDYTDFTSNFKSYANQAITSPYKNPGLYKVRCKGISDIAANGTQTNIDLKLTEKRALNGLKIILNNHVFGDHASFQVIDIDNSLGLGANYVLNEFGTNWYFDANKNDQGRELFDYASEIPSDLYLRLVYNSTGANDVNVFINYYLHQCP